MSHPLLLAGILLAFAPRAEASGSAGKALVLQGGTVHTGTGDVFSPGSVRIEGGKIVAVGPEVEVPEGADVLDATGLHVYPGLIDADSQLLVDPQTRRAGGAQITSDVRDALDLFQPLGVEDALAQGVTAVHATPRNVGVLNGASAVLKLKPRPRVPELLVQDSWAVGFQLGSEDPRPSVRLRDFDTLRKELLATRKYVEQWEQYEEDLKKYEEELEQLRAEEEKAKKEKAGEKEGKPGPEGEKKEKDEKEQEPPEKKEEPPPSPPPPDKDPVATGSLAFCEDEHVGDDEEGEQEPDFLREMRGGRPLPGRAGGDGDQGEGEKQDEKKEGPKKPKKPDVDPGKEILRKVLDGKLVVWGRADNAGDILNLLELKREFRFKLVLSGCREARHVVEDLHAAGVPVVLGQTLDLGSEDLSAAQELVEAGVRVALTAASTEGEATRFLGLCGAAAAAGGLDPEEALRAMTQLPAQVLGLEGRLGSLEVGRDADLVLATAPPSSAECRVNKVWIDGELVYERR